MRRCRYLAKEAIIIVQAGKAKFKHMEDRKRALKEVGTDEGNSDFVPDPVLFRKKIMYSCTKGECVAHTDKCPLHAICVPSELERYDYDY